MVKKALVAGLLLLALAVLQRTPDSPAVAAASVQGDVNCGGTVTAVDSLQVLRSVAGLSTNAACLAEAGDTNCDTNVTAVDALRILRHVAGLTNSVPNGCVAIGEALEEPPPAPTSEELIAAALESGQITYEESLLYRGLALYDLPDLPEEFRSPVIDYHAGRLLSVEFENNKVQLSQATLDTLEPILARPNDPISIFNNPPVAAGAVAAQTTGYWTSKTAAAGKVRVWAKTDWNPDPAVLDAYVQAATLVWPKLEQVFGLPTPDLVTTDWILMNPDNAIDIYLMTTTGVDPRMSVCLTHPGTADCRFGTGNGLTRDWGPRSGETSSGYVMLQNAYSGDELLRVVAHELAHVVQNKYDRHENDWLNDSTADWVAFRVMQELATNKDTLYGRAHEAVFGNPGKRLERDEGWSRYGAWLYFFFASQNSGDTIVKSVWQNAAAGGVQGIQAADQAIPFAGNFSDFTVRNWNQKPPIVKEYKEADTTFPGYTPKTNPWFFALDDERIESDELPQLSAVYYRYTFNSPIRKITVENLVAGNADLRVWALVKIGDDWRPQPEDWSNKAQTIFCRTLPTENVTDLVIIVSNTSVTNPIPATDKIKVKAETTGCIGWVGTATGTSSYDNIQSLPGLTQQDGHQVLVATTTANILWEEDPLFFYGCNCTAFFPVGSIDWSVSYSYESECCTCSDTATGAIQAGTGIPHVTYQMMIRWDDPNDPDRYFYSGGGDTPAVATIDCDGGFTYEAMDFFAVPAPDIVIATPSPTPTPSPAPTPTPTPTPLPPAITARGQAASAAPMCDTVVFTFPRDATTFSGSCYTSYESPYIYEKFDWSFTRVDVVQP